MTNLIKVENLVKHYGGFTLDRISLEVPEGCIVGFVGGNGAGKTTTLKAITGLIRPDGGSIVMLGEQIVGQDQAFARVKESVGVVFDTCPFPADNSIRDVGRIGNAAYRTWDKPRFGQLIRDFGIDEKKRVKELSRGMGMKLQLAFALAHRPSLLILDEATAGLDPLARNDVLEMLRAFMLAQGARGAQSRGILMSSHITSDLEKIADYVVCIDEGREVFSCPIDDIRDLAGVAHCRTNEADALVESGLFAPGELRVMRGSYSVDVLVPDRAAFERRFPDVACDRTSLDDYMTFMLKGEAK